MLMAVKKEKRVNIRATDTELKALKSSAKAAGLSLSEFIRKLAFSGSKPYQRCVDITLFREMYAELRKQGGNLNQIARNINYGYQPDHDVLERITSALEENERLTKEIASILIEARNRQVIINDSN